MVWKSRFVLERLEVKWFISAFDRPEVTHKADSLSSFRALPPLHPKKKSLHIILQLKKKKRVYTFKFPHKALLRRPKSLKPQALLKMHLIYHRMPATMAGLSAHLSVGPLSPTGEEKGRWLRLTAPVLTWAESRMWTIQVFSSRETQRWGWETLDALFSLGISLLCPLLFLTEGHSLCWMADREPRVRQAELQQRRQLRLFCTTRSPLGHKGTPPNSAKCAEEQSFPLHPQLSLFSPLVHLTIPCQYTQLRSVKRYIPLGHNKVKFSPLIPA